MSESLTTTEAALLADVAPSTIKRWADDGILASTRTAGGHRRILKSTLNDYLKEQQGGGAQDTSQRTEWINALKSGNRYRVDAQLSLSRGRHGSWYSVADEVGLILTEIGLAWRRGALTITDEHLASEALARAISRISDSLPTQNHLKPSLLACTTGDEHSLGLSLAELCVRELGTNTLWVGRNTPTEEITKLIEANALGSVVLSASSSSNCPSKMTDIAKKVGKCCQKNSVALYLGGSGSWPQKPDFGLRLQSFAELHKQLSTHKD